MVSKRRSGVGHPFAAGHADVVHPRHGEAAAQRHRLAKQHEAGHGGLPCALRVAPDAAQRLQQFFVGPAQFFGVGVGFGAGLAVVGDGFGRQVVQRGVGTSAGVEAFRLAALVEHGQIVVGAVLVGAADAAEGAFGQALGLEEDGFVLRLRLGHMHHHHGFAVE